jgi:hypothetical protein
LVGMNDFGASESTNMIEYDRRCLYSCRRLGGEQLNTSESHLHLKYLPCGKSVGPCSCPGLCLTWTVSLCLRRTGWKWSHSCVDSASLTSPCGLSRCVKDWGFLISNFCVSYDDCYHSSCFMVCSWSPLRRR